MTPTRHKTVGYAGIAIDSADGHKRFYRCPVQCNDTEITYQNLIKNVEADLSFMPGWDAFSANERKGVYRAACCTVLAYGLRTDDSDVIVFGIEAMHAILGQPVGFAVYLTELEGGEAWENEAKIWRKASYDKAKAKVDDFIDMLKAA